MLRSLAVGALLATAACGSDDPTDPNGTQTLAVTTASLSDGVEGQPYSETLAASGGDASYSWSVASGSLPAGLSLSTGGEISGTPTAVGTSAFSVQVTSGDGQTATAEVSIVIAAVPVLAPGDLCSANPGYAIATFEDSVLWGGVRDAVGVGSDDDVTCDQVGALTVLNVVDSGVGSLVGIQNLTGLVELDLNLNDITDVTLLGALSSLTILDVGDNQLTTLAPLGGLTALAELSVGINLLTDLSGVGTLTGLIDLDARWNSLTDVSAISGATDLEIVDLSENDIVDISALSALDGLTDLDLEDNQITDVSALTGLTRLTNLNLRDNALATAQPLVLNPGFGAGDEIDLWGTGVACSEIRNLRDTGATVFNECVFLPPSGVCGGPSTTVIVDFEDASLESEVRSELNVGPNEELTCTAVRGITNLDAASVGIVSLVGLQNLTALTDLNLGNNDVTDLTSIADLPDLAIVDLADNPNLSDIGPLIGNVGIGSGDIVDLQATVVACVDVDTLRSSGATVLSPCP